MLKKILMFSLIMILVFSFFDFALAQGPDYSAAASSDEVFYGETVTLTITTPLEAGTVKVYVDGRYKCKAELVSSADDKAWTADIVMNRIGSRKISFRAYSIKGKLLMRFPEAPVIIKVDHLLPVTETPIILDSDRAVLLGTPPGNCGVRQSRYGFYFGTDPGALTKVKSNPIIRGEMNKLLTGLSPNTKYYFQSYVVTSMGTFTGEMVSFITPEKKEWTAEDAIIENTADRYNYIFGATSKYYKMNNRPFGYATKSEADTYMVNVTVPTWKISHGKKVPTTISLTVNYKLENNVKAIFQEIYNLDIKYPIKTIKAYWYRRASGPGVTSANMMSHHSFGTAIDVNKPYNLFYRYRDKRNKKSPYYIPQSVIDIFEKYGWVWGGNFKEGLDTMHFQYLGLDLLGEFPG